MLFTTEWLVPGRVLFQRLEGDVTLEDVVTLNNLVSEMVVASGGDIIHSIVDVSRIGKYPQNLRDIHQIFMTHQRHPDGWFIVVTHNPLVRFLASMVSQMSVSNFRVCNSVDEAKLLLQRHDHSMGEFV